MLADDLRNALTSQRKSDHEERVQDVTCQYARFVYYMIAFTTSFGGLYVAISGLWSENGNLYWILGAASVAYIGMVIRCLSKDVPVPKYGVGELGVMLILWDVMIYMQFVSHRFQGDDRRMAICIGVLVSYAAVSIVQLSCPARDLTYSCASIILFIGTVHGILCGIVPLSNPEFMAFLVLYPSIIKLCSLM